MFWSKTNPDALYWMKRELADIVLEFYPYGQGSAFDLAKFGAVVALIDLSSIQQSLSFRGML